MNKLINGQNIIDKIVTAKHTITRQDVAKAVLKATKDDLTVPKRKHIDYLVMCTDNPNINILDMTKLLLDRAHNPHWIISFKALLTIHHIMNYGSSVFLRHMASNNFTLKFGNFSDTSNAVALCMSKFVRTYANYINSKATSFRILGLDLCKVKKGSEESYFRKLDATKLLESLFRLQSQIDDLLDFVAFPRDQSNTLMNSAHLLLAKDMVRLYVCYKDAMANLVGTFLDQDKKFCRVALPAYKKFLDQIDKIHEFLELSEDAGMSKFDIPKKLEVSPDLLEVFENHLKSFESVKKSSANMPVALPRPEERTLPAKRHSDFLERKTSASIDHEFGTGNQLQNKATKFLGADDNQLDAFKQKMIFEEFISFSEIDDSQFSKTRPASLYSGPKVSHFPESFFDSGNVSNLSVTPDTNQATAPPGFTDSGEMLQPTKLYSPVTPTLDFSKMSLSPHCNSHLGNPILFPYNNLQSSLTKIIPVINGSNISSPSYSYMMYPGQINQPQPQRSGNPFLS